MKIKFLIDDQPLVLTAKQAAVMFGKTRLQEYAEGRWTPFVFCEPYREYSDDGQFEAVTFNVTDMPTEEIMELIEALAPQTFTFTDDVMAAAEADD
jgi:hypothetical protein